MEQTQENQEFGGSGFISSSATTDDALNSSAVSLAQNPFVVGDVGSPQNPFKTAPEVSENSNMGGDGSGVNTSQSQYPFSTTSGGPIQVRRPVYKNYPPPAMGENQYTRKFKYATIPSTITTPILFFTSAFCCILFFPILRLTALVSNEEGDEKYESIALGGFATTVPLTLLCFVVCFFECVVCCVKVKPGCVMTWLILNGLISFLLFTHLIFLCIPMVNHPSLHDNEELPSFQQQTDGFRRPDSENSSHNSTNANSGRGYYGLTNTERNEYITMYYGAVGSLVIGIICLVVRLVNFGYILRVRKSFASQSDTGVGNS